VLLHALACLRPAAGWSLAAVHVHHGLHPEADAWTEHCRQFCASLAVPLRVERVDVGSTADTGLEAAARRARYAALAGVMAAGDVLLTAHHLDDQAETILLQLLRGAGVAGLAAMPAETRLGPGWHARPLLPFRRAALRDYASREGLRWIEDSSNLDTRLGRNFLRHRVIPLLESHWPSASEAMARAAGHAAEAADLVEAVAELDLRRCRQPDGSLGLPALVSLPEPRQRNVLRQWIRSRGLSPPAARTIDALRSLALSSPATGHAERMVSERTVYYYQQALHLPDPVPELPATALDWNPERPLELPGRRTLRLTATIGAGLSAKAIAGRRLSVDWRQGGESCRLAGQPHQQALKKILQSASIPPWERFRIPLLRVDGELAAIGDRWVCEPFTTRAHEPGFLLRIEPVPDRQ
jgi:tRNA(Ile)-lysidine synthase